MSGSAQAARSWHTDILPLQIFGHIQKTMRVRPGKDRLSRKMIIQQVLGNAVCAADGIQPGSRITIAPNSWIAVCRIRSCVISVSSPVPSDSSLIKKNPEMPLRGHLWKICSARHEQQTKKKADDDTCCFFNGGLGRNRTNDTRIFSPLLYRLSYETFWLREKDLNQRPSGYEPDELPDCSIPRCLSDGGGTGIRTQAPLSRPTGFQDRTLQPLGYSSIFLFWWTL